MSTEEESGPVDYAALYLSEGQDTFEGAGHHEQSLRRADVLFQASAAASLYEIAAALKIMLPMVEALVTPPQEIRHQTTEDPTAQEIEKFKAAIKEQTKSARGHFVYREPESAHRSSESQE